MGWMARKQNSKPYMGPAAAAILRNVLVAHGYKSKRWSMFHIGMTY